MEPGEVRDALARTLGDPSLVLGLWLPERGVWADEQGRELAIPTDRSRGVTYLGDRLAVLTHDRDLLDQPRLLESVGSAARLALENERLHAELRAQLDELRESRARIVKAGDEERRRLERDLHDGAQQRLLGIGLGLQLLRPHVHEQEPSELLEETERELELALTELRGLARGIHPAVLSDHGIDAAIRTLAERASFAVAIEGTAGRLPEHIETAAYFVVAEALTNVAKHANANRALIRIGRDPAGLTIEIDDDGVGAANPGQGSGLHGLADRVGALGGTIQRLQRARRRDANPGRDPMSATPDHLLRSGSPRERSQPADRCSGSGARTTMSLTVLIVDDHPGFRRFARKMLEQAGFSVVGEADDCASGIEAAETLNPDAILLDILLPDGSGLDLAVTLAAKHGSRASVVLMSSRSAADHGSALTDTPAHGFIAKGDLNGKAFAELIDAPNSCTRT